MIYVSKQIDASSRRRSATRKFFRRNDNTNNQELTIIFNCGKTFTPGSAREKIDPCAIKSKIK